MRAGQTDFQFELTLPGEYRVYQLQANPLLGARAALDQVLPRLGAGFDFQQIERDLIDFGNAQLL